MLCLYLHCGDCQAHTVSSCARFDQNTFRIVFVTIDLQNESLGSEKGDFPEDTRKLVML